MRTKKQKYVFIVVSGEDHEYSEIEFVSELKEFAEKYVSDNYDMTTHLLYHEDDDKKEFRQKSKTNSLFSNFEWEYKYVEIQRHMLNN